MRVELGIPRRASWRFLEVFAVGSLIALALLLVSGLYDYGLDRAKTGQAVQLIATLDRAVRAYHDVAHAYPPGDAEASLRRVVPLLMSVPQSRDVLHGVSGTLLYAQDGLPHCRDPWGVRPRCLTARSDRPDWRRRVEQNGRVPIFESAGPDRSFGDADHARQADNICSDEPLEAW